MTTIIRLPMFPGEAFEVLATPLREVFVADQPRMAGALDQPHRGLAYLTKELRSTRPGGPILAEVTMRDSGLLLLLDARCLAPATNIAARRILPRPPCPAARMQA